MRTYIYCIISLICTLTFPLKSIAASALIDHPSSYTAKETSHRLVSILQKKGMTIFARIDHQAGAKKVNKTLRFTEVIIFGNPAVGTTLMQCAQSSGIDLPLKVLVWEDEQGSAYLSYRDPKILTTQHNMTDCHATVQKITRALNAFARAATTRPSP